MSLIMLFIILYSAIHILIKLLFVLPLLLLWIIISLKMVLVKAKLCLKYILAIRVFSIKH